MSRLEQLIQELCPEGVERFSLGAISKIKRGERITKSELILEAPYPVISGGVNPMGFTNNFNRNENTITVSQYGTAGFVNWQSSKFWANDVCYSIFPTKNVLTRFLFYSLLSKQDSIYSLVTNAVPAHLPQSRLAALELFLPPLPVQEEIVRILDTFTALEAELEKELQARTEQYEYYRDALLNFDPESLQSHSLRPTRPTRLNHLIQTLCPEGVEYEKLGNICNMITTGKLNANAMVENGKYPFFTCDANPFRINTYAFDTTAIIVSGNGSQVGHINYYEGKFNAYQRTYVLAEFNKVVVKFLLHYLNGNLRKYIILNSKKGSVPYITMPMLEDFLVPVPPLPIQEEIVTILDRFEVLVNDLKNGLPAEIALRRKQYEYYRDQLLTFPPLP